VKKKLILITVVLVLMSFFSVYAFGQWYVSNSIDEMEGTESWFAISSSVKPTKSMEWPYNDVTASLVVGYNGEDIWVYVAFNKSPNLQNDITKDGYNLIHTRIKWDESVENTTLTQEWNSKFIHFRDDQTIISKIEQSNTVLLELDWYGQGEVYFSFPLDGSEDAINEIYDAFNHYNLKTSRELTSAKSRLNHLIRVNTVPKDGGYIQINESGPKESINEHVESGTKTTLTAIPEEGYVFEGWFKSGIFVTDENPYITEFTSLTILEARFISAGKINVVCNTCKLNENIKIELNGKNLPPIASFVLYITYDTNMLEPAKKAFFSKGKVLSDYDFYNATMMDDGKIKVSIGTTKANPTLIDGIIGILEFISKGTKGETNITITDDSKILGVDYREMKIIFEQGTIYISD